MRQLYHIGPGYKGTPSALIKRRRLDGPAKPPQQPKNTVGNSGRLTGTAASASNLREGTFQVPSESERDAKVDQTPSPTSSRDFDTHYGKVHVKALRS